MVYLESSPLVFRGQRRSMDEQDSRQSGQNDEGDLHVDCSKRYRIILWELIVPFLYPVWTIKIPPGLAPAKSTAHLCKHLRSKKSQVSTFLAKFLAFVPAQLTSHSPPSPVDNCTLNKDSCTRASKSSTLLPSLWRKLQNVGHLCVHKWP